MNTETFHKPLVLIGYPCGDMVHADFAMCLYGLGRGSNTLSRQGIMTSKSSILANSRNNLAKAMLDIKADWLLQIDSDMKFPPNALDRLLAHDKDIVGCSYVRRGPPFDNLGKSVPGQEDRTSGLVEMEALPTGFLLCRRKVFETLERPWFRYGIYDTPMGPVNEGEDVTFCKAARAAGFQIWCDLDLSVELRHLYTYELSPMDPSTRAVAENFKKAANG